MLAVSHKNAQRSIERFLICALVLTSLAVAAPSARAAEIIPSMGMTRTPESGDDTNLSYGLAVRAPLAPMVSAEIGVGYRTDTMFNGMVESTQWPVTGSLWFSPMPSFYVGGGAGWYNTTLHYPNTPVYASVTSQEFGMHVGGGLTVPMIPMVASLDLNGRYVYLGDQTSEMPPSQFNANFWTTSLGIALHF